MFSQLYISVLDLGSTSMSLSTILQFLHLFL
nr:MAG TPA: hypothetical protein [Caudoviricetes sp.]